MEKLSVIVPVYNVYPYLRQCLESIINQTYKNLELIIVNDASPYIEDDEICKEYASKDERIIYIKHETNKKQGGARNTGIKAATGKYIAFIDSDDYLCDMQAYEECIKAFNNEKVDAVTFGLQFGKDNTVLYEESGYLQYDVNYSIKSYFYQIIYKRNDLINNNIYFPENVYYEDGSFIFKYLITVKPIFYNISKPFYYYRDSAGQTTKNIHNAKDILNAYYLKMECLKENNMLNDAKNIMIKSLINLLEYRHYLYTIEDEEVWDNERIKLINFIDSLDISDNELFNAKSIMLYGLQIPNKEISKSSF